MNFNVKQGVFGIRFFSQIYAIAAKVKKWKIY